MTRARAWIAVAVVPIAVVAAAASARGDELTTALDQPMREVSHSVAIRITDGIATYKVQRVFVNQGDVADEAGLAIDLPFGAAATGLRIRARDRWYDAELMEREKAAELYQKLTGHGAYAPKDPALLQWLWADKLYLQVFPVLPGQASTVEYTLTVPTRYQSGKIFLSYPRATGGGDDDDDEAAHRLASPIVTVEPGWGDATTRLVIDGQRTTPGSPVVLGPVVRPSWFDAAGGSDDASYVASTLTIPSTPNSRKPVTKVVIAMSIAHTFRGDLRVDLLTPNHERVEVFDGNGGGTNDLNGSFPITLPTPTAAAGVWRLVVSDHAALDVGTLDAWSITLGEHSGVVRAEASDLPLFIPDAPETDHDAGLAVIEVAPPTIEVMATRLGRVIASKAHGFARFELDMAAQLQPLPRRARVVFVIDGSWSIGATGIAAQLAIVRAYLSHLPDATAEVVVYRRTATRLFGSFVASGDVAARLDAAELAGKLDPGNGSALDDGVRVGAAALGEPAKDVGPLRMVITGDEMMRRAFDVDVALASLATLPAAAVVHVVTPGKDDGEPSLRRRDDGGDLSRLADTHHGIHAGLTGLGSSDIKAVPLAVLGLVRPIQIDDIMITGYDAEDDGAHEGEVFHEGDSVRDVIATEAPPGSITITGKIWGDDFRRVVRVDSDFSRAAAGWIFSEDDQSDLSEAEQMKVARMGRAVSPVTSYLAVEPGTRPSTIGLPKQGRLRGRRASAPRVSIGSPSAMGKRPDLMALLAPAAERCVAAHHPPPEWSVKLTAETTVDEIVDVIATHGGNEPIATCLIEAVWAVRLTGGSVRSRDTYDLAFH